jgi:hypothetical protein
MFPATEAPYGRQFEGYTDGGVERAGVSQPPAPPPPFVAVPESGRVGGPAPVPPRYETVEEAGRPGVLPEDESVAEPRMPESVEPGPVPELGNHGVLPVPAEAPRGPFLHRVQRMRDWLREQFGVRGMFLLDREGGVIFDDGVNDKLQSLARSLAQASRVSAGAGSNVHVKVGAEATLEVIPADTHYGVIVLGAIVPHAVSPRGVALIIDAMKRTAMPPG